MTETNITMTMTVNEPEPEELRIAAYSEHLWMRCPKSLRDHFDTKQKGVFEISPPCFEYEEIENESISFTFRWGTDLMNVDIPLNSAGIEEHLWVPSLRGLKYIHPSRAFNKIMKHKYQGLWNQQHFKHIWDDSGDIISLTISWDLTQYIPPKSDN